MQIEAVIARLKQQVSALRSVQGAAELNALRAANALPPMGLSAFVIPLGLQGGEVTSATELFVQDVEEQVSVLLTLRHQGRTGEAAIEKIEPLIEAVLTALGGWAPPGVPGCFRLVRAGVASMDKGTFTYLITLAIGDQLRIFP